MSNMILVHSSGREVDLEANSPANPLRPLKPGAPIDLKIAPNGREGYDFTSTRLSPSARDAQAFGFTIPSKRKPRASLPEPTGPRTYQVTVDWVRNKGAADQAAGTKSFEIHVDGFADESGDADEAGTLIAIQHQQTETAAGVDKLLSHFKLD